MRAFGELVDGLNVDQFDDGLEIDLGDGPPRPPGVVRDPRAIADLLASALDWSWPGQPSSHQPDGRPE